MDEVIAHFVDPCARVSAHYTIDRDGTVVSHVAEQKRAWHAGPSRMKDGRIAVNDFSIGIELVNRNDGQDPYPEPQVQALQKLLRGITQRHPIQFVVTHAECAEPPGRKIDPMGFDMCQINDIVARRFEAEAGS